jgi:enoyl-CoA hydratase
MPELVYYELDDANGTAPVATVTMDDGKVNVLSFAMFDELRVAFDRAEREAAAVVLAGRPERFSAGFDLGIVRSADGIALVRTGFEMSVHMLAFPKPVVIACTGHAIAMGSFLVLSGDHRIGAAGPYKITANEVAIGLVMPTAAVELIRSRLTPSAFQQAVGLARVFTPADAVAAGYLDEVVTPDELLGAARDAARSLAALDPAAHATTKLRARAATLEAMQAGIDAELAVGP